MAGTDLRRVLSPETGLVLVTLGALPPVAGRTGVRQVLVADTDAPVGGFDAVVADPDRLAAARFGLAAGRIMIRPDGYVGAVADGADVAVRSRPTRP
ncbi:hypothetical protein [Streptacidiphilus neutrinimicus]|uniref:hypothetical protein n=1 Tax=Streptacidiphilus neutrinimicus TaxID=105420 RepID=UPI0005A8F1B7|nr:hypothetical protein [Streptacidiphilus neutrinimicus]